MNPYLQLIRPHHSLKNVIIFLPLIFGGGLTDLKILTTAILGFIVFCGISSFVYILNDIRDIEKDKLHKTKCNRPLASGKISINSAKLFATIIIIVSLVLGAIGFGTNIYAWLVLALYVVINIGYSLGLKNIPLLDIFIIASGFLLRVMFGSFITDIEISKWLLIMIIVLSLYLSLYKRKSELERESNTRAVLKSYTESFLDRNLVVCMVLILVFYSLWCIDTTTISRLGDSIIWTIPLTLLICMKFQLNESSGNQDPINIVIKDKVLLSLSALYGLIILLIIYGPL